MNQQRAKMIRILLGIFWLSLSAFDGYYIRLSYHPALLATIAAIFFIISMMYFTRLLK